MKFEVKEKLIIPMEKLILSTSRVAFTLAKFPRREIISRGNSANVDGHSLRVIAG